MNEIIAVPNPLPLVTGIEGSLELGGQVLYPALPQGSFPERFSISSDLQWQATLPDSPLKKVGGTDGGSSPVVMLQRIPKEQSFWTHASPGRITSGYQSFHVGVLDNLDRFSGFFAQANPGVAGANWGIGAQVQGVPVGGEWGTPFGKPLPPYVGLNINIENNQIVLRYEVAAGVFEVARFTIPNEVTDFRTHYNLWRTGTTMYFVQTRVDEAIVPIRSGSLTLEQIPWWFGNIRNIDASHLGVTGYYVGDYTLRLSHPYVSFPLDVVCQIAALYIRPVGTQCGGVAVQGTIIQFESNGGQGGIFTATGGTILSGLRWQAPYGTGDIDFSYTIGAVSASCRLSVVPKLTVEGVDDDGYYPDIAQGEIVTFHASCEGAIFTAPYATSASRLITKKGVLSAPLDAHDEVFGEKIVVVRVSGCGQVYEFKVRIQAMYPTPQFCGPIPMKWLGNEPDFLSTSSTMTGGTSQVKNRNGLGILTWEVQYQTLKQTAIIGGCSCVSENHSPNCRPNEDTAQRLSDFYRFVSTAKYFSMVDYHTGITYKFVRLTEFSRDHVIYETEQSRRLRMRYEGIPIYALLPQPTVPSIGEGDTEPIAPPINDAWEQIVIDFIYITGITDELIGDLLNNMVIRLRTEHLWDNLDAIYPMVGGTAHAHRFNLKNPIDHDKGFRLTMIGTFLHGERGAYPVAGLSGHAFTHYVSERDGESDSVHLSFWSLTDGGGGEEFGAITAAANKRHDFGIKLPAAGSTFYADCYAMDGSNRFTVAGKPGYGYFIETRNSPTGHFGYLNGDVVVEEHSTSVGNAGLTTEYTMWAVNSDGAVSNPSPRVCSFATIGTGLVDKDAGKLDEIVREFQTALGRAEFLSTLWVLPLVDSNWRFDPTDSKMSIEATVSTYGQSHHPIIPQFTKLGEWVEFKASPSDPEGASAGVVLKGTDGSYILYHTNGTIQLFNSVGTVLATTYGVARPPNSVGRWTKVTGAFFSYSVDGSPPTTLPWRELLEALREITGDATPLLTGTVSFNVQPSTVVGVKIAQPWTNIGTVTEGAWTPMNLTQIYARYLWNDIIGKQDGDLLVEWKDSVLDADFYYLGSTAWSPTYREAGFLEFNNNGMLAGGSNNWYWTDCAFYLVFRVHDNPTGDDLWDRIFDKGSLGGTWFGVTGTSPAADEIGGGFVGGAPDYGTFIPFTKGNWYAAVIQRDGTRQFVHLGTETEAEPCLATMFDGTQFFLGCDNSYANTGKFDIKELVVCNDNLSPQDMLNLSTYTQNQYGLAFGDPTVLTFLKNTGITDSVQIAAIYQLVADLKAAGVWAKCHAIYPMIGGTADAHKWNLKNVSKFPMTFVGGWVHSATGAKPDGAYNTHAEMDYIPSASMVNNSTHLAFYSRTNDTEGSEFGSYNGSTSIALAMKLSAAGYAMMSDLYYNAGVNRIAYAVADSLGFGIISRTTDTEHNLFRDGQLLLTDNDPNTLNIASHTVPLWMSDQNSSGTSSSPSGKQCAFASMGLGLTEDEMINYTVAVRKFQIALGRNVSNWDTTVTPDLPNGFFSVDATSPEQWLKALVESYLYYVIPNRRPFAKNGDFVEFIGADSPVNVTNFGLTNGTNKIMCYSNGTILLADGSYTYGAGFNVGDRPKFVQTAAGVFEYTVNGATPVSLSMAGAVRAAVMTYAQSSSGLKIHEPTTNIV